MKKIIQGEPTYLENENGSAVYIKSLVSYDDLNIVLFATNGQTINLPYDQIDLANSVPALTGLTPAEIVAEVGNAFFFEVSGGGGLNVEQFALDTGYTPEFTSVIGKFSDSNLLPLDTAYAVPLVLFGPISYEKNFITVRDSNAGLLVKSALYASGDIAIGDLGVPKEKIFDFLDVDASSIGNKLIRDAPTSLEAGVYWFVFLTNQSNQLKLRGISNSNMKNIYPSGFSGPGSAWVNHMEQALPFASGLPQTFTTAWTNKVSSNENVPLLFFKK